VIGGSGPGGSARIATSGRAVALLLALGAAAVATAAEAPAASGASSIAPVVVTGNRLPVETLIDRKVYSLSVDLQSSVGTVADVLAEIPSIEVDADGNVSLRGDSNVLILVDGRPLAQLAGASAGDNLQQIPAQDIEKIEVMTNPPAQYKADGVAGVINIVTRKERRAGLSGTAQASAGNRRRALVAASSNYNAGALNLSAGVSLRQDDRQRLVTSELTAIDPASGALTDTRQRLDEHIRRWVPLIKAGAEYAFTERTSLALTLAHAERSAVRSFDQHDDTSLADGTLAASSDRRSSGREWQFDANQRLEFRQRLRRPDETLSVMVQRSAFHEREHYDYANYSALPVTAPSYDDLNLAQDLIVKEASADYALPLDGARAVRLGYDFERDDNAYDDSGNSVDPVTGVRTVVADLTNQFRYLEDVHAAYGSYQTGVGAWQALAGLRVERTRIDTLQLQGRLAASRSDLRAYPSLQLHRALSDNATLSVGVSRRVSRPDPDALNPFADHQDTHNLRAGNPNLLPQDTQLFELGYGREVTGLALDLTGYFRRNRNKVTDVTQVLAGGVTLTTKANLPQSRLGGIEFSANGRLATPLAFGLSGNLYYSQIDGTGLGTPGLRSTSGVNLKANLDYHATALDTAQVSFTRSGRRLTPQGYVSAVNQVNLGYRRQLRPHLSAIATVSDAFNGQVYRREAVTPAFSDVYQRRVTGRIVYVGLLYSYGSQKKAKPGGFEYEP
jgi:outer membrane receptor protein involved in Fe transport